MWAHLSKVLSHVIAERPRSTLESVIPTSHYVLTGSTVPPKPGCTYSDPRAKGKATVAADILTNMTWASNFRNTVAPPKPPRRPLDGDEEEEEDMGGRGGAVEDESEDPAMQGTLSDVVVEQKHFNAIGVGLIPEESFRVVVGLKALMRSEPISSAAFWGVIHGIHGDYYIAETKVDPARLPEADEEEPEDDEEEGQPIEGIARVFFSHAVKQHHSVPKEEAGTGLNEFVYYAASSLDTTQWAQLPDITPQQVTAARLLRNAFTGDLEAEVPSHPRFPGVEKHYLRAQIARITCTTKVAPKDMFTTEGALPDEEEDDDGNPIPLPSVVPAYPAVPPLLPQDPPEEDDTEAIQQVAVWYRGYSDDELLQGKYWVHVAPTLLLTGRTTTAPPPEAGEEDDGGEPDEPVDNTETINPFLSDLSKDATISFPGHSRAQFTAWTFRRAYQHESCSTAVYLARSLLWPGAMTCAVTTKGTPGATYRFLYIGSGLKSLQGMDYFPQLPPRPLFEYVEGDLALQRDCTVDEELEYAPPPPKPSTLDEEEPDEEEED